MTRNVQSMFQVVFCHLVCYTLPRGNECLPFRRKNGATKSMSACLLCAFLFVLSCQSASLADVRQAHGDFVRDCLPSRLSRVRVPSPALLDEPPFSTCFTGRLTTGEQ